MINSQGILIESGNFYVDSSGEICYVETHSNGELIYSDRKNRSPITLGRYADQLVGKIGNPEEQAVFISNTIRQVKPGQLEASAQSIPKCTGEEKLVSNEIPHAYVCRNGIFIRERTY